jgi:heme A synthase
VKLFRSLAVASVALAFAIAVLGSWIRINNAGLTCPDWPLCKGAIVPVLQGGIVLEWTHRAIAFAEGFVVLGAIAAGWRLRDRIAGIRAVLAALGVVFAVQVVLGGATVLLGNSPASVMLHWGMGMALLATLTTLALLAILAPSPADARAAGAALRFGNGPAPWLAAAAVVGFVTMCVGAYVSSSYAGLACATFPGCDGTVLGRGDAQFSQMLHRLCATAFALVAFAATAAAFRSGSTRVRAVASVGIVLLIVQATLGALNVLWQLPTGLREAHAANAGATFLAFVIATVLAALDPLRAAHARTRRATASTSSVGSGRIASAR